MKDIGFNLALFVSLAAAFSGLTGCSGTSTAENGPAPANSVAVEKKSSEYPPIPAAVAQSEIKNLDGSVFKVEDRKGKVTLLNMWATWCGPCRSEMPTLVKMQQDFHDKDFDVIGLNTDDEPAGAINNFAAQMNLNYPLVYADTTLQNELVKISKFGGIPQSFLIDRDGKLRGVFKGANPNDVRKMQELVGTVVNE